MRVSENHSPKELCRAIVILEELSPWAIPKDVNIRLIPNINHETIQHVMSLQVRDKLVPE